MTANTPFPIDPIQTAISVAYRNTMYIADMVLPRVPVGREEFKYLNYPVEETFRLPDTTVGRRGRVNEVTLTATETIANTLDYGLEDPIPFPDIDQAQSAGIRSPIDNATQTLTDYIALDREVRTAALVFDAAQYPTGHKVQLAGTDQWDQFAEAASDPIEDILAGMDAALLKPTHAVMGSAVWLKLRVHPKVVSAVLGNDGTRGIVTRAEFAELFELQDVLVGENRLNTAKYGQDAVLSRVWGKHFLLYHHNPNADARQGLTFGYTAQYQNRVAGTMSDPKIGLRGGVRVRVGESVKELIVAPLAAYFIEDAVS
jgi:hypothetical protein